ncbi:uncharacterized protein J7T54_006310 [Emericellopsis cladophorae]|uniref:Amidoligase enzyme-domain-containing protein n=1 Tax=Emericellopsis cladophorae TaxID=2686198 RepID=A0A9P9Y9J8_9HYPO|nr:uncharacterized protein J7T54_006310 [Emericellopsis cladophorae]KAI6785971.1 hypothetical protein J7T54_006310 [Emericellopsis cladophorae]
MSGPIASNIAPTTPPRASFGVELEFLVAERKYARDKDPDSGVAHCLPPLYDRGESRGVMIELFKDKGIPLREHGDPPAKGWLIECDPTCAEPREQGYAWEEFEISSPATFAREAAFLMIRLVVSLITSHFRCRVNASTGFHVHVGNGYNRIPLQVARNFASLWWAVEPLLSILHPPERAFGAPFGNGFSDSTRRLNLSRVNQNKSAKDAATAIWSFKHFERGRERFMGELVQAVDTEPGRTSFRHPPVPVDHWLSGRHEAFFGPANIPNPSSNAEQHQAELENPEVNPRLKSSSRGPTEIPRALGGAPAAASLVRRFRPTNTTHSMKDFMLTPMPERSDPVKPEDYGRFVPFRKNVWSAIQELVSCDRGTQQLAELLMPPMNNKYVNFNWLFYTSGIFPLECPVPDSYLEPEGQEMRRQEMRRQMWPQEEPHGAFASTPAPPEMSRNTVEMREAMGSLDPTWIVTWAKICVGLYEFSQNADPAHLMQIIHRCVESVEDRSIYDIVDFLGDVGLWAEARVCEDRLRRAEEAWFECMILQPGGPDRQGKKNREGANCLQKPVDWVARHARNLFTPRQGDNVREPGAPRPATPGPAGSLQGNSFASSSQANPPRQERFVID